jgi:hypothetical protein
MAESMEAESLEEEARVAASTAGALEVVASGAGGCQEEASVAG